VSTTVCGAIVQPLSTEPQQVRKERPAQGGRRPTKSATEAGSKPERSTCLPSCLLLSSHPHRAH
jgi:hypothetical protein